MSAQPYQYAQAESAETQTPSPAAPDMRALDAALRDVFNNTHASQPELDQTIEVVSRAANTIDELIERNRSITEAAVRSVEFFRAQVSESRAENDRLREEVRALTQQNEAQRVAARAHAEELEAELALRSMELDQAKAWIAEIRTQVETLLGDAETKLAETSDADIFQD